MTTHSSILAWRIPMDKGAWRAPAHGVTNRWTRLSDWASLIVQLVKNPLAIQETPVQFLDLEDLLEKG